jgi:hypothetical protein
MVGDRERPDATGGHQGRQGGSRVAFAAPLEVIHLLKELRNIHTTASQQAQDSVAVSKKIVPRKYPP